MGSPKALLSLHGRSFLAHLVGALAEGGCDPVLVVVGPEDEADARRIADEARSLGARVAVNPDRGSAQIDSLRAAERVLAAVTAAIVASPVDAPGATATIVRALIETSEAGAPIVVPTFEGRRGHPVLFARSLFAELLGEPLAEGARTVIQRHERDLVEVPVADPGVLLDIDTPADYRLLREEGP